MTDPRNKNIQTPKNDNFEMIRNLTEFPKESTSDNLVFKYLKKLFPIMNHLHLKKERATF